MPTGSRCKIYDKIDALDGARSVQDIVKCLKPILNELAYYAVTGEGAVMDTQEEWHTNFKEALHEELGLEQKREEPAPKQTDEPPRRKKKKKGGKKSRKSNKEPTPAKESTSATGLTPALQAIMGGTHPSLNEDEDPDAGLWARMQERTEESDYQEAPASATEIYD